MAGTTAPPDSVPPRDNVLLDSSGVHRSDNWIDVREYRATITSPDHRARGCE